MVDDPCRLERETARKAIEEWAIAPKPDKEKAQQAVEIAYKNLDECQGPEGYGRGNLDYCAKAVNERNSARRALEIAIADAEKSTIKKATSRLEAAEGELARCIKVIT